MAHAGIEAAAGYAPRYRWGAALCEGLGGDPGAVRAPDEDGVTLAWEALAALTPRSDDVVVLAVDVAELEPRAVAATLTATGVLAAAPAIVSLGSRSGAAAVLDAAGRLGSRTTAVVVDAATSGSSNGRPSAEGAIALQFGAPRVAAIAAARTTAALTFDRWRTTSPVDLDGRFVEETLVMRNGSALVESLLAEARVEPVDVSAVVLTCVAPVKASRLQSSWKIPVIQQVDAGVDGGSAAAIGTALRALADAGEGAAVLVLDLGWGGSGAVLVAGPEIASVSGIATSEPTAAYGIRDWLTMHGRAPAAKAGPWTSPSELRREIPALLGPVGTECGACAAVAFPAVPVCDACGSPDVTAKRLARTGTVLTHSLDALYAAPDATHMVVVELDGGGRFYGQAARGCAPLLDIDDPCRLVLRRLHSGGGLPHYFWKVDRRD
jgi:uncharacterized OB-fold protein